MRSCDMLKIEDTKTVKLLNPLFTLSYHVNRPTPRAFSLFSSSSFPTRFNIMVEFCSGCREINAIHTNWILTRKRPINAKCDMPNLSCRNNEESTSLFVQQGNQVHFICLIKVIKSRNICLFDQTVICWKFQIVRLQCDMIITTILTSQPTRSTLLNLSIMIWIEPLRKFNCEYNFTRISWNSPSSYKFDQKQVSVHFRPIKGIRTLLLMAI